MPRFNRRHSLAALAAMPVLATGTGAVSAATTAPSAAITPLARIRVGRFEVTALTDGWTEFPAGFFTNREPASVEAAAADIGALRAGNLRVSFNQFLVADGDRRVLIDTGPAGRIGETGKLPATLDVLGVSPDTIDAVIFTHLHFDHISGAIAGGRKVFAHAQAYAGARDVAYFSDPGKRAAAPDFLHSSFDATAELLRLYPDLAAVDGHVGGEQEISSGLSIVDLAGHTPGHIGVRIADAGESLIMTSDMLFHPAVHPRHADVGFVFEQDPAAAEAMRTRFFSAAASEGTLVASTHMPFPGLGRIVADRGVLTWITADWAHGFE